MTFFFSGPTLFFRTVLAMGMSIILSTATGAQTAQTTTPIEHLIVIYQENVSFDHYFATYPHAANLPGEPRFDAAADTPAVNGLSDTLLQYNPNAAQPFRLSPKQAATCDMDHGYTAEQQAANHGLMDKFVEFSGPKRGCDRGLVMGYFDGNTVHAVWDYAHCPRLVELRTALRDERQPFRNYLRSFHRGRVEPDCRTDRGRHDQKSASTQCYEGTARGRGHGDRRPATAIR